MFYFLSIISAFVIYSHVFHQRIRYSETLFISLCALSESSKTYYFLSFYTAVVNDSLHEPYLLLTNSSFILILSELHMGCLIWVKFVEILKQKFESQLDVIYLFFM